MKDFQKSSSEQLQKELEKLNYWNRLHNNKLLAKMQDECAARIIRCGLSQMITYYDEHLQYLCTIHRIITKGGVIIHEHVKDACLNGIWYKAEK